jgi:hypothetical protein
MSNNTRWCVQQCAIEHEGVTRPPEAKCILCPRGTPRQAQGHAAIVGGGGEALHARYRAGVD